MYTLSSPMILSLNKLRLKSVFQKRMAEKFPCQLHSRVASLMWRSLTYYIFKMAAKSSVSIMVKKEYVSLIIGKWFLCKKVWNGVMNPLLNNFWVHSIFNYDTWSIFIVLTIWLNFISNNSPANKVCWKNVGTMFAPMV